MGEDQDLESAQSLLLLLALTSGHPNCFKFEVAYSQRFRGAPLEGLALF